MNKTINIDVPEGFEIDTEKSNLAEGKIVFKKKATSWRKSNPEVTGFYIDELSDIIEQRDPVHMFNDSNENIFATKKQAQSMLAMAQLSQIIKNDKRFGGPIADKEWEGSDTKYTINRYDNTIITESWNTYYHFLAFHTKEQAELFLMENEDLIKQYFMID